MTQHLINYSEIKNLSINDLIEKLSVIRGININDMTLKDFIFYNNSPITSGCGVYIFKNKNQFYYVGDCSSRSFIERIPCHFDTRPEAWMNVLLKHYTKRSKNLEIDKTNLENSAIEVFADCTLIMINFEKRDPEKISKLEKILLSTLNPINKSKRPLNIDLNLSVDSFIN